MQEGCPKTARAVFLCPATPPQSDIDVVRHRPWSINIEEDENLSQIHKRIILQHVAFYDGVNLMLGSRRRGSALHGDTCLVE